jgi:putative superfamily III holin-X
MLTASRSETSFFGLVRELKDETQALVKEEVALAKTEMSEKMSCYVKNGVSVAIGGFVAYAGAIVLFLALGSLLGHWFTTMGVAPHLAFAAGWGAMGLLVVAIGGIMIMKAIKTFSASSLAPEKTIETIHELKGDHAQYLAEKQRKKIETPNNGHKRSSGEIKTSVETTQQMMGDTMEELKNRLTPKYMGKSLVAGVKHHPGRTAFAGAVTGLLGFVIVRWRMHQNHAAELARMAELNTFQRWVERFRQARNCR